MRILSWNCNGGFRNKLHLVADLNADVLVIQECEDPINGPPIYYEWADQYVWAGRNKAKGLGIFAKNGLTLLPLEWEDAGTALFLPVEVSVGMQIVGVWTQASASSRDSYIGQFWHYFQLNRSQFGMKTPPSALGKAVMAALMELWMKTALAWTASMFKRSAMPPIRALVDLKSKHLWAA